MKVYRDRGWGLALHVSETSNFWKYFQVQSQNGEIVGGPGDGGSHTPDHADHRLPVYSQGKSYDWFKEQKNGILEKYNTVYGIQDYNEFITNGLSPQAIAGVLHYTDSSDEAPSDLVMCYFLARRVRFRKNWPIYAYSPGELKIERYLSCPKNQKPPKDGE